MTKKKLAPTKPVPLGKGIAEFLATLAGNPVGEAAAAEYANFIDATRRHEESWVIVDATGEAFENSPGQKNKEAFENALLSLDKATKAWFGAYDKFTHTVAHANDAQLIPEEELQQIIKDSMSGNTDGIQFSINSGMLAFKIAHVLRPVAIEDDELDPPLCDGCSNG